MNGAISLAKRNFLCFFRDRASVVFSLMAVIIVVLLYLLFLRNVLIDGYPEIDGMSQLVDAWVLAGIMGIVSVTASAGSLQIMIDDRHSGKERDLLMTAMPPYGVAAGYVLSTFMVGFVLSLFALALSVCYLAATGCPLSASSVLIPIALTVPSALSGSIVIYALTSFLKSPGAFSGFFTVTSILIGFLTGVYMPMGSMPAAMQTVGTLLPATQMSSLFRKYMSQEALDNAYAGAPAADLTEFRSDMGFDLSLGGFGFDTATSLIYVAAVTALFFVIAVVMLKRRG